LSRGDVVAAGALAAWASLLKPQGALVPACAALALMRRLGPARAALFAAASYAPLAAWLVRNAGVAGTATAYADNWASQLGGFPFGPHALHEARSLLGSGLLGWAPAWPAALALAGLGAVRLGKTKHAELSVFLASYVAGVLALHLTWPAVNPRYAIVFCGPIWLLMAAGAASLAPVRAQAAGWAAAGLLLACGIRSASAAMSLPASFEPFLSLRYNAILLLGRRPALPPPLTGDLAAYVAANEISFVHLEASFKPGGFLPRGLRELARELEGRVRALPGAAEAYRSEKEGAVIYRVRGKDARTR
jgi:hypothetical protein